MAGPIAVMCDQAADFIGMHIIIMPPQFIIIGMPICIMPIMFSQHFMNMSFMDASIGIISQVMPVAVMVHFIWQAIIGMPPIIMGFIMLPAIIIGFIIPPDIMEFIGFIMPPIIIGIGIICIAAFIVHPPVCSVETIRPTVDLRTNPAVVFFNRRMNAFVAFV